MLLNRCTVSFLIVLGANYQQHFYSLLFYFLFGYIYLHKFFKNYIKGFYAYSLKPSLLKIINPNFFSSRDSKFFISIYQHITHHLVYINVFFLPSIKLILQKIINVSMHCSFSKQPIKCYMIIEKKGNYQYFSRP